MNRNTVKVIVILFASFLNAIFLFLLMGLGNAFGEMIRTIFAPLMPASLHTWDYSLAILYIFICIFIVSFAIIGGSYYFYKLSEKKNKE